ncbi:ORF6N domain-containing protein [Turicibacter sanguinis]|uniref:ORF6N domain-containing protein n=1 Tax=Turicibacter sanguinis TaxID=154288 RepID=UPI0006C1AD47|nr:ORF6C domain-containing protein [Turicibacter sanguinis]CUM89802.1 ORF6C domain [Turicibacter sanguinis]
MSNIYITPFYSKGYESVNLEIKGTQEFLGKQIPVVYGGFGINQKVVLAKTIAEIHGMEVKHVNEDINNYRNRFKDGIDVIDLKSVVGIDDHENLKKLGFSQNSINRSKNIYLLSERGYAKLIKIMDSDLAWEIHDQLMDEYFSMREEQVNPYANLSPELQSIIMLDQKQQILEQQVQTVQQKVNEIEENAKLDPAEYSLVSKRVSSRVYEVQKERQMNLNKKQIGELFRALNKDILEITGVKTRTQLRQKHLDMVLDFINDWYPSRAAMFNINQMSLEI